MYEYIKIERHSFCDGCPLEKMDNNIIFTDKIIQGITCCVNYDICDYLERYIKKKIYEQEGRKEGEVSMP